LQRHAGGTISPAFPLEFVIESAHPNAREAKRTGSA